MTGIKEVTIELVAFYPDLILGAADFYAWPSEPNPAACVHTVECPCPWVGLEWFDQRREHKPVAVRTLPRGLEICLPCAIKVVERHRVQVAAAA